MALAMAHARAFWPFQGVAIGSSVAFLSPVLMSPYVGRTELSLNKSNGHANIIFFVFASFSCFAFLQQRICVGADCLAQNDDKDSEHNQSCDRLPVLTPPDQIEVIKGQADLTRITLVDFDGTIIML